MRLFGVDLNPKSEPKIIHRLVVIKEPFLSEAEIDKALAGNAGTQWYKALVQMIDDDRRDNLLQASRAASAGNTYAMAGALNVYEAFTGLLLELDKKVSATSSE